MAMRPNNVQKSNTQKKSDGESDGKGDGEKEQEKKKEQEKEKEKETETIKTTDAKDTVLTTTGNNPTAVHIMMTVLLQSGHQTLTHAMARIDRFGLMLYKMQRTHGKEKSGIAIVDACHSFFSDNPHYFFCVVDGMIQREYLSVGAFAKWVCARTTEVLAREYQFLEYLNISLERSVTGQYTRSAATAANIPKPDIDEMETLVTEEERQNNVYDMFSALRDALAHAEAEAVASESSEDDFEMKKVKKERAKVLKEFGTAMSSLAKNAAAEIVQVVASNDTSSSMSSATSWDLEKMRV